MNKMPSERLFSSDNSLLKNGPMLAILGGVIFFVVAHPFLFQIVDHVIEQIFGEQPQRELLLFIHSVVFGLLMYVTILIADRFKIVENVA